MSRYRTYSVEDKLSVAKLATSHLDSKKSTGISLKEELNLVRNEKKEMETAHFKKILEQLIALIKLENKNGNLETTFEIPVFVPGIPIFDPLECAKYLMEYLYN